MRPLGNAFLLIMEPALAIVVSAAQRMLLSMVMTVTMIRVILLILILLQITAQGFRLHRLLRMLMIPMVT